MTAHLIKGRRPLAALLPCALFLLPSSANAQIQIQRPNLKPLPQQKPLPDKIKIPDRVLIPIDPTRLPLRRTMYFYKLGDSNVSPSLFRTAGNELKVKLGQNANGLFVQDADGPRGVLDTKSGLMLIVPDLRSAGAAPNTDVANRLADNFVKQLGLVPRDDAGLKVRDISIWTKQNASPEKMENPMDCLRSVHFARTVSALPVFGPNSVLDVTIGAKGVEGVSSTLRALQKTDMAVKLRPDTEVKRDFDNQLETQSKSFQGAKPELKGRQLVYLEQGMQYAQPVYRYDVVFQSDVGTQAANSIFVQAASNSPEQLMDMNNRGLDTPEELRKVSTTQPKAGVRQVDFRTGEFGFGQDTPQFQQTQAGGVKIGLYIVREDHECWLNDANAFMSSLNALSWITGKPAKVRQDYLWNYPQYWHESGGNADLSRYLAGKVNMAWLEGHGAPWLMTTYKNNAGVIHANQLKGFGTNMGLGEITNYMVWQGCDIVPVPGDGFGGDFGSGSPFNVWWGVFKGMRGAYGYRTTMGICNGVGAGFGLRAGMGIPNLASWLSATASNPQGHPDGWNYGSAVIVTGHENDTLYNTGALPNPSQLTMWWNHA
ncbi:hypothetical protein IAD21_03006 [Abditibacteriota bacterium]|nr:hypothetical protein IAD21_03006 [Abditibacteriota bacterium]